MKNGTLDRNTFETIEAYLLDRMDPSQRSAFELRLLQEADLQAEVDLQRENIHAVELGGFLRTMKNAAEQGGIGSLGATSRSYRWIGQAAAILILLAVSIWIISRPSGHEAIFTEHFRPDPGLPVVMGTADDAAFADAMAYYREDRFEEARARWSVLLTNDPTNDTLLFYCGMSALAVNDAAAAITRLEPVAKDGSSAFQDRAEWYLFLSYVRSGNTPEAKKISSIVDEPYADQVRSILKELDN